MDKKEFLKELDGRGFDFQDKSYTEFGFNDEILNMVYEMYCAGQQAQAVPEGFVVLAIDDMERICRCLDDHAVYITYKASDALESIQKAMNEAQQPSSTPGCPDEP